MTYSIAERFRFYPACYSAMAYSAIASTSEPLSERVRDIYINPLLGITLSLSRARASREHPECRYLQISTNGYRHPQKAMPRHIWRQYRQKAEKI